MISASTVSPGPDCDGTKHRDECASVGLPSAYGIEMGCTDPATFTDGAACRKRKAGLDGCVPYLGIVCCPP